MQSRKSRDAWSNRKVWPWSIKWSRAKANKENVKRIVKCIVSALSRECTGYSKHPFPKTQETTLCRDITRWLIPKSDWLYSCEILGWMKHKLESRLPGEISKTSDMQICYPYGRKWRGTKELLDEGERGEWKSWLKTQHSKNENHGIWSHQFMANRWGNSETLFSWAPKSLQMVTAAMKLKDICSLEEKLWPTSTAY